MHEPARRYPQAPPFIGRSLREAFNLLMTEFDGDIGRTHPEATPGMNRVMVFIDPDGTSMAELARRCGMTRQSILEHVVRLETCGYVTRRAHRVDRRIQLVTLTEHGHLAIADGFAVMQGIAGRWTTLLGTNDMGTLIELLDRLVAAVRPRDPSPGSHDRQSEGH